MSFAKLRQRNQNTNLDKLADKFEKVGGNGGYERDDRIWKPQRDKAGNAYAVIRLLPISEADDGKIDEDVPVVQMYDHAFQGPGGWLIDHCATTIGQECPVCKLNNDEWDDKNEAAKNKVRPRSRKMKYYANAYIITDTNNPENEGKVKLFEFGKEIMNKIKACTKPRFPNDPKFDPFNLWDGANMELKVYTEDRGPGQRFPKYDDTSFSVQNQLFASDQEMEVVWKQCHPLHEIIADDKFKSFEDIENRLNKVMKTEATKTAEQVAQSNASVQEPKQQQAQQAPVHQQTQQSAPAAEDSPMSFFDKLASGG